jgi:hypothetical protein
LTGSKWLTHWASETVYWSEIAGSPHYVVYWMACQLLLVVTYLSGYGIDGAAANESILTSFQK